MPLRQSVIESLVGHVMGSVDAHMPELPPLLDPEVPLVPAVELEVPLVPPDRIAPEPPVPPVELWFMHVPLLQMRPVAQSVSLVQPLLPSSFVVVKQPCARAATHAAKGMKDLRPTIPSAMRPRFGAIARARGVSSF